MSELELLLNELSGVNLRHIPGGRYSILNKSHYQKGLGDIIEYMTDYKREMIKRPNISKLDGKWIAKIENNSNSTVTWNKDSHAIGNSPLEALQNLKTKLNEEQ